jgi:hypothetical protein
MLRPHRQCDYYYDIRAIVRGNIQNSITIIALRLQTFPWPWDALLAAVRRGAATGHIRWW